MRCQYRFCRRNAIKKLYVGRGENKKVIMEYCQNHYDNITYFFSKMEEDHNPNKFNTVRWR